MALHYSSTSQRNLPVTGRILWADSAYMPERGNTANVVNLPLTGSVAPFGGEGSAVNRGQSYEPGATPPS